MYLLKATAATLALLLCWIGARGQQPVISGTIRDAITGEALVGVQIVLRPAGLGTTTNNYGYYSLRSRQGQDSITVSLAGYIPLTRSLNASRDTVIHLELQPNVDIEQVVVEGSVDSNPSRNARMGAINVPMKGIERMPVLLGERDVFRTVQLQPGVTAGLEGTSGLYVRGGGVDQNLVILDDAPVYNPFHMLGMFSLFNGSAVKGVEITKGAFPARFGGRLSSVLEVVMAEGSMRQWSGEAGIGLISSHAMLQGPIVKDKASFILTARRTYLDLLLYPILRRMDPQPKLFFYDVTAKVHWQPTPRDRLYLSGYFGRDGFGVEKQGDNEENIKSWAKTGLRWGNLLGTLRWNRTYGSTLFSNLVFSYAHYDYQARRNRIGIGTRGGTRFESSIRNLGLKYELQWDAHWYHRIRVGINAQGNQYAPQALSLELSDESQRADRAKPIYSGESALYLEDDWSLWHWGKANIGIRAVHYATKGYAQWVVEPRASLSIFLSRRMSIKGGFAIMNQHMHLLSSFGMGLPTDIWVPASAVLPSQRGWIASIGLTHDLPAIGSSISIEAYYKRMKGNIAYGKHADSFFRTASGKLPERFWEHVAIPGRAWSTGIELFFQRRAGRLSGWLGYTLSWTKQQFDALNGGREFWARYDRRHDFSIVAMYEFTPRWRASATWVYSTGAAVTLPAAIYAHTPLWKSTSTNYSYSYDYAEINSARMAPYHRLDLGVQYVWRTARFEHTLSADVYNAYCRFNALYYDMATEQRHHDDYSRDEWEKLVRVSLFPILPSLSYRLSF